MLAACSQAAEPGARTPPESDQATVASTPSATPPGNEGAVACRDPAPPATDASLKEPSLSGDVDGDRRADRAYLVVNPEEAIGCRVFLVVETDSGSHALAIDRRETSFDLGLPALVDLRQVDGRPGLDPVVDLLSGASTVFAGVFSMQTGTLRQLRLEGGNMIVPDLVAHGGSIGHIDAAGCSGKGVIVISGATPAGRLYVVERRFYRVDGPLLRLDPSRDQRAAVKLGALPSRFPEFAGPVFSSCPTSSN